MKKELFKLTKYILCMSMMFSFNVMGASTKNKVEQTLAYANEDVNGDGLKEQIYAKYIETSNDAINVLIIKDSTNKKVLVNKILERDVVQNGEHNVLKVADFDGDGKLDIMVAISMKGSGGMCSYGVFSFAGNQLKELKTYQDCTEPVLDSLKIDIKLKKQNHKYYLKIKSKITNQTDTIDITKTIRPEDEVDTLVREIEDHGKRCTIADFDMDGKMELAISTELRWQAASHQLANLTAYYKYIDGKWQLIGHRATPIS